MIIKLIKERIARAICQHKFRVTDTKTYYERDKEDPAYGGGVLFAVTETTKICEKCGAETVDKSMRLA